MIKLSKFETIPTLGPVAGEPDNAIKLNYVAPGGAVGFDEFTIELAAASYVGTYAYQQGDRVAVEFDVTFGDSALSGVDPEYMVVLTSVRYGGSVTEPTCGQLGPGGDFQEADFDYVSNAFSGVQNRQTTSKDSTTNSQVCENEGIGNSFDSLVFDSTPGQKLRFGLEIEQTVDLTGDPALAAEQLGNLDIMLQGYRAPVPEPNTGVLVLMGLVALASYSKSRRSQRLS